MLDKTSSVRQHLISPQSLFASPKLGRPVWGMVSDFTLVGASFAGAHLLRFGGLPPSDSATQFLLLLLVVALMKVALFRWFQLYHGLWRHAGTPEAIRLVQASTLASVGVLGALLILGHDPPLPIAVLVLDWMLTIATTGGRRFGKRALSQYQNGTSDAARRVLIYGADRYAVFLLRYLRHAAPDQYAVVGFYDPAPSGHKLKGLPIVTTTASTDADSIIVPIPPDSKDSDRNQICADCAQLDLPCHRFQLAISAPDTTVREKAARTA